MSASPRRSSKAAALLAALAAVFAIAGWTARGRRRAEEQRIAEAAARLRADGAGVLREVLDGLTDEVHRAAGLAPLRAALVEGLDVTRLRALLARAPWWTPFRTRMVLVVTADGRLLDSEPRSLELMDPFLVENARARPPAAGWVGAGGPFAAAAAPVADPDRGHPPTLLILGRPFDLPLAQAVAARLSATVLLTDTHRKLTFAGDEARRDALTASVGREGHPWRAGGDWVAVAVPLAPGRWVWALRAQPPPSPLATAWLAPILLALSAVSAGLAFRAFRQR